MAVEIQSLPDLPAGTTGYTPVSAMVGGVAQFYRATFVAPADFTALLARVAALETAAATPATPVPSPGTTPGATPIPFTATDLEALYALAVGAAAPTTAGAPFVNGREWAWTPGTASGTTALTAAMVATAYAALPSAEPSGPGRAYQNGKTLAYSAGASAATTTWTLADWAALFAKLPSADPQVANQPYQNARTLAFS